MTPSTLNPPGNDSPAVVGQVNPDAASATMTLASNAAAPFSATAQNVTLTANVTSSGGTVNEGSVNFTVKQGSTVIGTATAGNVTNGSASVSYALPAGTTAGSYTIEADYTDSSGTLFSPSSDNTHTLTIGATTTTASNASVTFSPSAQTVTLSATVTSTGTTVNEGAVTFTLKDSHGTTIGAPLKENVANGSASGSYALPAGTAAGSYTIEADYSDSPGTAFASSSDTSHALTVNGATTTVLASSALANFSSSAQDVTLSATVTSSASPVNEGSVTFTLFDSNDNTVGTSTSAAVNINGLARVSFVLPGGTPAGSYKIDASYNDSTGNFNTNSDFAQTLTITGSATTVSLSKISIVPNQSNSTAQMTVTAKVSNSSGVVDEGEVTLTLGGVSGHGTVANGAASVQLTVPLSKVSNLAKVALSYTDTATPANFADASTTATVALNVWNILLPTNLTFDASGNEQNQVSSSGSASPLGFSYTSSGLLTQVQLVSLPLPVTYSNIGGNTVTTFVGAPTAITFVGTNDQVLGNAQLFYDGTTLHWVITDANNQPIGETPYGF